MTTKEKLEILWKYLALAVLAVLGFLLLGDNQLSKNLESGDFIFIGNDENDFHSNSNRMDVQVEKEIINGDTLMKVEVNGKTIDKKNYVFNNGTFKWQSNDGKVVVLDLDDIENESSVDEKNQKVVKKKVIIKK